MGDAIPLEGTYCRRMVDGALPNAVGDTSKEDGAKSLDVTRDAGIGSYVGVPLRLSDGRVWGSLCCLSHSTDESLGEQEVGFMGESVSPAAARLNGGNGERKSRSYR